MCVWEREREKGSEALVKREKYKLQGIEEKAKNLKQKKKSKAKGELVMW